MNRITSLLLASIFVIAGVFTTPLSAQADELPDSTLATVLESPDITAINVRTGPGIEYEAVSSIPSGTDIQIGCWTEGSPAVGPYGETRIWYTLVEDSTKYVSDAFLWTNSDLGITRHCGEIATQQEVSASSPSEEPVRLEGLFLPNDGRLVADTLFTHYYATKSAGEAVIIDWTFFSESLDFVNFAYTLPIDEVKHPHRADVLSDFDMYVSLGTFDVTRTSQNCFLIGDMYDFGWDYAPFKLDASTGAATPFRVHSSGCLTPP